jgi:Na+-translocating ferredoxin:NAD+ oxidoreductase subunit D
MMEIPMDDSAVISSPHLHKSISVAQVMRQVIYALVPGILLSVWFFGIGVFIQCLLAVLFALGTECLMLWLRGKPLKLFLFDGSAVVTALLFALTVSPLAPFWVNLLGICFAIILAKHCFGGLGYNMFNPAMAGYVFVLLCFPAEISAWPHVQGSGEIHAGLIDTLTIIFAGQSSVSHFDSLSGATALEFMQSQINGMVMIGEVRTSPIFGTLAGKGSEWIAVAWLAGGIWLLYKGIIKWQLPGIFLSSLFLFSLLFYWYDTSVYLSPLFTLFAGGTMLAAFFIVTDPVTAATTPRGTIIYACGIGLLTYIIRTWGSYPDGVAFAVLLMNAAVPLIDTCTRRRVFGEK